MKKVLLSLSVLVALVIVGCGGSAGDPKAIAKDYLTAVAKMDFEKAKKFGTDDTKKFIDMMSTFSAMVPDSVKKKQADAKIDITGEPSISGDDATVSYSTSEKAGSQTLKLKKVNGKWLVQQSKEEAGAGEMPSMAADSAATVETPAKK
jgi:hypothetical protein